MNCLEFKRLALSDPSSKDHSFVEHREKCVDCLSYVGEILKMDADLADSLQVDVPTNLTARLQLTSEMQRDQDAKAFTPYRPYAIAASVAIALFVGGFIFSNQLGPRSSELTEDYQKLLAGVVEHVNEQAMTPVWETATAHQRVNALLASYDDSLTINQLENLQFGRICPMGQYKGLHATLESGNGQITFAYIKGERVGDLLDTSYQGYVARVKPVKGGNLIIVSRTKRSLDEADAEIQKAFVWDI